MKTKTSNHLKSLIRQLEKHRLAIAKERDGMRKMQDDIEDLLEPTSRGLEALEDAIAALSEQA